MSEGSTVGDLVKAKAIAREEIDAAVDAILADQDMEPFKMGGYVLDLAAAVAAHLPAALVIAASDRPEAFKRTMARTAILLVRPEQP